MAVKFIGTVSAVAVSVAGVLRFDAIAICASEQLPETCRVSSDAVRLVRATQTVGDSVANERFRNAARSYRSDTLEFLGAARFS